MLYIISGTDRPGARSLEVAEIVKGHYAELGEKTEVIDLKSVGLAKIDGNQYGDAVKPVAMETAIEKLNQSDGIVIICPEYNGSYPGALKYFIDHWQYPKTFEFRPVCFVGLGGRFGGLRPVEHLQSVFGYRNAFIYPERVFLTNIWSTLSAGVIADEMSAKLLKQQCEGFLNYVKALQSKCLDANSR